MVLPSILVACDEFLAARDESAVAVDEHIGLVEADNLRSHETLISRFMQHMT